MAAVFPETLVKRSDGKYDAYFRDANDKVTVEVITQEQVQQMVKFSYERFGRAPNTKIIGE